MARDEFVMTLALPLGPGGSMVPISNVAFTPYHVNPDGSEGSAASAFAGRTGSTPASSLINDADGTIQYWLDTGDYNIHVDDQEITPRFTAFIRGFISAPLLDTTTLATAMENIAVFVGDLKWSMQSGDHGLKTDGTYEWLRIVSAGDGGGRLVSQSDYTLLWSELGEPALDMDGNFRLPNLSGRTLIATGSASGLSVRSFLEMLGEETHTLVTAEMPTHMHTVEDPGHQHPLVSSDDIENLMGTIPPGPAVAGGIASGHTADSGEFGNGVTTIGVPYNNNNPWGMGLYDTASTGITLDTAGSDQDHNNMQPSTGMNLFVKT